MKIPMPPPGIEPATFRLIFKSNTISETYYSVIEAFVLLGYYTAYDGSWLPTFRDSPMVRSSRFKHSPWTAWPLKMGPVGSPETPRHIAEEQRPQPHGGGNLISHSVTVLVFVSKISDISLNTLFSKPSLYALSMQSEKHVLREFSFALRIHYMFRYSISLGHQ